MRAKSEDVTGLLRRTKAMLASGPNPQAKRLLAAALGRAPQNAELHCRLADALHLEHQLAEARGAYLEAVRLDDQLYDAWYGLGAACLKAKAFGAAAEALRTALGLRPDLPPARINLAEALFQLGQVDLAAAEFRQVADADLSPEATRIALANLACILPGDPEADTTAVLVARRRWLAASGAGVSPILRPPRPIGDKLRIGYVSSFFGSANWMKPVFGVINHHDRSRFEVHLIATGEDPSPEAGYLDHDEDVIWRAARLANRDLAVRIASMGLDVLVDLNGYSDQQRLFLFLHRPAPVQVGWFNMFATTGLEAFDRLVGDAAVIPPEEEAAYSEAIARAPGTYLAFRVLYPTPSPAPPPCLERGFLTFGCLGSAYKITDQVLAAWARILRAAPAARLFLKNGSLGDASNRASLLARFAAVGVEEDRLTLEGRSEHFDFLAAYDQVDIALDTFPYNGGTTTTEALWQGVPVLSFNGDRWAGRTSRSLLLAAGLHEWVAADESGFVDRAVALAADAKTPGRLSELRADLRRRLAASPACDTLSLCRFLEGLFTSLAKAR